VVSAVNGYGIGNSTLAMVRYAERSAYTVYESVQESVKFGRDIPVSSFLEKQVMAQAGVGGLIDELA